MGVSTVEAGGESGVSGKQDIGVEMEETSNAEKGKQNSGETESAGNAGRSREVENTRKAGNAGKAGTAGNAERAGTAGKAGSDNRWKIEEHGSLMGYTMGGSSREVGMTGMELEDGSKGMIEITI